MTKRCFNSLFLRCINQLQILRRVRRSRVGIVPATTFNIHVIRRNHDFVIITNITRKLRNAFTVLAGATCTGVRLSVLPIRSSDDGLSGQRTLQGFRSELQHRKHHKSRKRRDKVIIKCKKKKKKKQDYKNIKIG